jgi:hypothetical protein
LTIKARDKICDIQQWIEELKTDTAEKLVCAGEIENIWPEEEIERLRKQLLEVIPQASNKRLKLEKVIVEKRMVMVREHDQIQQSVIAFLTSINHLIDNRSGGFEDYANRHRQGKRMLLDQKQAFEKGIILEGILLAQEIHDFTSMSILEKEMKRVEDKLKITLADEEAAEAIRSRLMQAFE